MENTHQSTPATLAWIGHLQALEQPIPPSAWRLMAGLAVELYRHNQRTGYKRIRLGQTKAAHLAGCTPRNAQRLIRILEAAGVIDRIEDGSGLGMLTGIPAMKLKHKPGIQMTAQPGPGGGHSPSQTDQPGPSESSLEEGAPQVPQHEKPPAIDGSEAQSRWAKILSAIRGEIDAESFECFIQPLTPVAFHEDVVQLDAPNDLIIDQARALLEGCSALGGRAVRFGAPLGPSGTRSSNEANHSPTPLQDAPPAAVPARRPITRKVCERAAWRTRQVYQEMAARGRRPSAKLEDVFAWVVFHATYGAGSENLDYSAYQAVSGALSMLKRGTLTLPAGFQPELIERYLQCARPILGDKEITRPYDIDGGSLRHWRHERAA